MRFIHIADLHIGKRVKEFSLLEDQAYILKQILDVTTSVQADAVIIAGDLYDKSVPPGEAIPVLDEFLTALAERNITVLLISGNHDSAERLSFGSRLLIKSRIFIDTTYTGELNKITLEDNYGKINIFTLPFVRPARIQKYHPELTTDNYEDAVKVVIEDAKSKGLINTEERNVLVSHQFVTGSVAPELSDSESTFVGTLEAISCSLLDCFDYVALGHLHCPQTIGKENICYAGSPLKYSFSEVNHKKSVTVIDLKDKKAVISRVPLKPLRDMIKIKGKLNDLISEDFYRDICDNFVHATLTDENDLYDPLAVLRAYYPNILHMEHIKENRDTVSAERDNTCRVQKDPIELFKEFYEYQKKEEFAEDKYDILRKLLKDYSNEEAEVV